MSVVNFATFPSIIPEAVALFFVNHDAVKIQRHLIYTGFFGFCTERAAINPYKTTTRNGRTQS